MCNNSNSDTQVWPNVNSLNSFSTAKGSKFHLTTVQQTIWQI